MVIYFEEETRHSGFTIHIYIIWCENLCSGYRRFETGHGRPTIIGLSLCLKCDMPTLKLDSSCILYSETASPICGP